jgi:hypothetical protein
VGQKTLGGGCKCVEEMKVGWGVWFLEGLMNYRGPMGGTCLSIIKKHIGKTMQV